MHERHNVRSEVGDHSHDLMNAIEHIIQADEIIAGSDNNAHGRLRIVRSLLRTIGRLLDEAGTIASAESARSDELTSRELRAVVGDLDIPADRRAFDVNAEVQALLTSDDCETNDLTRERLRNLRNTLNWQNLD